MIINKTSVANKYEDCRKTARLTMSKKIWTRSFSCNCSKKNDLLRVLFESYQLESFLAGSRGKQIVDKIDLLIIEAVLNKFSSQKILSLKDREI